MVLWAPAGGPLPSADTEVLAVQVGDDPWGRAVLDLGLACQALFSGGAAASEAAFTRALAGFRATGDRWGMANCLDPLGAFADWRDGLHSHTRRLVFGDESRCLRLLDHYVAGFDVPNHLGLDRTGRVYSEPGRAVVIGNYDGDPDRAGALLVFRSERLTYDRRDIAAQKRIRTERFAGMGWEAPAVLKALEDADDLYFDAIAQIHVDRSPRDAWCCSATPVTAPRWAGWAPAWRSSARTSWPVNSPSRAATTARPWRRTRRGSGTSPRAARRSPATRARSSPPPPSGGSATRDRMYRLLGSRPLAGFFKRLTEKAATAVELPEYPV